MQPSGDRRQIAMNLNLPSDLHCKFRPTKLELQTAVSSVTPGLVGPENLTQVGKLAGKHLYLLSHLAGPPFISGTFFIL